jgi:prefoldin subunit 5
MVITVENLTNEIRKLKTDSIVLNNNINELAQKNNKIENKQQSIIDD